jgi:chromosome segregation ATPase
MVADKVDTEHPRASEAIGHLREAAIAMKEVGDDLAKADKQVDELKAQIADWEERLTEMEDASDKLAAWEELLCDFKSGIRDRDELLAGTVGR